MEGVEGVGGGGGSSGSVMKSVGIFFPDVMVTVKSNKFPNSPVKKRLIKRNNNL